MSTITFNALIKDIHFDPKKGALKIQLIGTSHVSLDALATLGPHDETVQVTLENAQTMINVYPSVPEDPIAVDEKGAAWLKEAARKLGDSEKTSDKEDKIATEGGE